MASNVLRLKKLI